MDNKEFYKKIHDLSLRDLGFLKIIIDYEIALKPYYEIVEQQNKYCEEKLKNSTINELLDKLNVIEKDLGQADFIDNVVNRLKEEIKTELSLRV
jgi:hypothetical protein